MTGKNIQLLISCFIGWGLIILLFDIINLQEKFSGNYGLRSFLVFYSFILFLYAIFNRGNRNSKLKFFYIFLIIACLVSSSGNIMTSILINILFAIIGGLAAVVTFFVFFIFRRISGHK